MRIESSQAAIDDAISIKRARRTVKRCMLSTELESFLLKIDGRLYSQLHCGIFLHCPLYRCVCVNQLSLFPETTLAGDPSDLHQKVL